jgi:hypothetical protein
MPRRREGEVMLAQTKRLRMSATRVWGLRRGVPPKPSPDLRVFRVMSKLSRAGIRRYIDGALGPH